MLIFLLLVVSIFLSLIGHVLWGCSGIMKARGDDDSRPAMLIGSIFSVIGMFCSYAAGAIS